MTNRNFTLFTLVAVLVAAVEGWCLAFASGSDAGEIMQRVVENLKGPPGKTLVAQGRMEWSTRNLQLRIARYFPDGTEGFQVDFLSTMEDEGGGAGSGRRYRVVRDEKDITSLTYLPSQKRGKKIPYTPTDGVLGSAYRFYFLPVGSDLTHDFSYKYIRNDPENPIIGGTRTRGSRSPFPHCEFYIGGRGTRYVVEKAVYYRQQDGRGSILQLFENYEEFTEGYWAPKKIWIGDITSESVVKRSTTLTFSWWASTRPLRWLHSTNNDLFDIQTIPLPVGERR